MANLKLGKWEIDEELLSRQYDLATLRGEEWSEIEPQAQRVSYESASEKLILELKNGVVFQLPKRLVQGLASAPDEVIQQVQMGPRGASLHWESLDLDFSIAGLLAGIFGTRTWMAEVGRKGGQSSSPAKAEAARRNGKKGGRVAKIPTRSS